MKQLIILIGLFGLIGGLIYLQPSETETYEREVEVIATSTESILPSEWRKEAQEAYEAVIRKKEFEAESKRLEGKITALKAEKDAIDKELGSY